MLDAYSGRTRISHFPQSVGATGNRADGLAYSLKLDSILTTHISLPTTLNSPFRLPDYLLTEQSREVP